MGAATGNKGAEQLQGTNMSFLPWNQHKHNS